MQVILTGEMTGYLYDASDNRVAKGTITTMSCDITTNGFQQTAGYVVGPNGEQLTEVDGNNNWVHTNVYAGGKLIGTYDGNVSSPTLHYYFDDPLGTRRAQASAAGVLEAVYQSLPFGDGYAANTTDDPTENHFTGKERDTESGNDYFGARYYASSMGRFSSPDWAAKVQPVPYAKLDNPQTLNLYAYVGNNPIVGVDPDGHLAADISVSEEANAYINQGWNQATSGMSKAQQQTTGNIVYNETGGLRPKAKDGSGSSQDLHYSRVAVADVIDNRNKAGAKGGVASDAVSAKERNNPQYKDSQAAASEAANSPDRTGGSTHFYLDYGQPRPSWANGKATTSYGPFVNAAGGGDVPKGADVRIVIVHPEDQQ